MSEYQQIQEKCNERQKEYDKLSYDKICVKFHMARPFSTHDYIRIDGLLAYFSLLDLLQHDFYNLPGTAATPCIHAPLPVEKSGTADKWFWCASFGIVSQHRDNIARWKKRWDDEHDDIVDFGKKLSRVNHKAGWMKAYDIPINLKNATEIVFFLRGNTEEIRRLLKNCKRIGKKRSQGYGEIKAIEIETTKTDWSCWIDEENKVASRAIPIKQGEIPSAAEFISFRPPYWHHENKALCYKIQH